MAIRSFREGDTDMPLGFSNDMWYIGMFVRTNYLDGHSF